MFRVGEYVVCGSRAVCRVEAIGPLRFKECGGGGARGGKSPDAAGALQRDAFLL